MPEESDLSRYLAGLNAKIRDLEEKQNLIKEKTLLLGQSFLKQEENLRSDVSVMKDDVKEIRLDLDRIKERVDLTIQSLEDFARKDELLIFEKQMRLWDPLKFVKEKEVKEMIEDALKKFEKTEHPEHRHKGKSYIS